MCLLVSISLISCELETSSATLEKMIERKRFEICVVYYGGIVGKGQVAYTFVEKKDSINVKAVNYTIQPNKEHNTRLSKVEFKQVKNALRCMLKEHRDEEILGAGCQPPFYIEYFIHNRFSKMRLYPKQDTTCDFVDLIYSKYKKEDLLEFIGGVDLK